MLSELFYFCVTVWNCLDINDKKEEHEHSKVPSFFGVFFQNFKHKFICSLIGLFVTKTPSRCETPPGQQTRFLDWVRDWAEVVCEQREWQSPFFPHTWNNQLSNTLFRGAIHVRNWDHRDRYVGYISPIRNHHIQRKRCQKCWRKQSVAIKNTENSHFFSHEFGHFHNFFVFVLKKRNSISYISYWNTQMCGLNDNISFLFFFFEWVTASELWRVFVCPATSSASSSVSLSFNFPGENIMFWF